MKNPMIFPLGGILAGILMAGFPQYSWGILIFGALIIPGVWITSGTQFSARKIFPALAVVMAAMVAGYSLYTSQSAFIRHQEQNLVQALENLPADQQVGGTIISNPVLKRGKYYCEVTDLSNSQGPVPGSVLIHTTSVLTGQDRGKRISFTGYFHRIEGPEGYQEWLRNRGIFGRISVSTLKTGEFDNSWVAKMGRFRAGVSRRIQQLMPGERNAGLFCALVLGDKSLLDRDLREDYSAAGISHLLAISGMHIGIIFMILSRIMGGIWLGRRTPLLRTIIILMILWIYAVFTGLEPAVFRATVFISLFSAARAFHLQVSRYNLLGFTALLLLFIRPGDLFSPGFQLSFAAVLGIFLLGKKLENYISQKLPQLPRNLSSALSISLAAQLFTSPFILFHFGSFPSYFLLTNFLIAIPSFLLVGGGFAGLILMWIPVLGGYFFVALNFFMDYFNLMIAGVARLPGAVIQQFSLADPGMRSLFLLLTLLLLILNRKVFESFLGFVIPAVPPKKVLVGLRRHALML